MRIIWLNKGDSGVGLAVKCGKLNTCFFVVPSEILLNERKRKGGRGEKRELHKLLENRRQMEEFKGAEYQVLQEGTPHEKQTDSHCRTPEWLWNWQLRHHRRANRGELSENPCEDP